MNRPRGRLGLAADQVEHRGLASAIGADDDPDLVVIDVERQIVDRLEAVKGNRQSLDRKQEVLRLVTYEHVLSPHSAGAPSATELSVQPLPDFAWRDVYNRSTSAGT